MTPVASTLFRSRDLAQQHFGQNESLGKTLVFAQGHRCSPGCLSSHSFSPPSCTEKSLHLLPNTVADFHRPPISAREGTERLTTPSNVQNQSRVNFYFKNVFIGVAGGWTTALYRTTTTAKTGFNKHTA